MKAKKNNDGMDAYLVVNDMLHIGDVQSSCCHISS